MGFQSKYDFARHINKEHGLPVYEMDPVESSPATPVVSSIKGASTTMNFILPVTI